MTEEEEILGTLDSIDGHLDVFEKYVDDSAVLAESGKGNLEVLKELNGKPADYGMACSPLVVSELVIVTAGAPEATVVAYDRQREVLG